MTRMMQLSVVTLCLSPVFVAAQETPRPTDLVEEARALEVRRLAEPGKWKALLTPVPAPAITARILISMGRVGDAKLRPVLAEYLKGTPPSTDAGLQRAEALAVGLFGDPDLLALLAPHVHRGAFAKAAGMKFKVVRFGSGGKMLAALMSGAI